MKLLLKAAIQNRKHLLLLLITFAAMCMLTVVTQMEMFSLKVMTSKGSDFFELFATKEKGIIQKTDTITREQLEETWQDLDKANSGKVSKNRAQRYLAKYKTDNLVDKAVAWFDRRTGVLHNLKNLAFMLLGVAILKGFALFANRYTICLVAIRVSRDLRQRYFEHIQSLPMSFYQQYNIGSLSSRVVSDAQAISEAINFGLINYLQTPFTVITTLVLCFFTSWELSLLIFFGFPLIVIPVVILAKNIKRVSKQIQKNQEHFASVLIDFLAGIQTVKIFAMEGFSLKKYRQQNEKMAVLEEKSARYDCSARPITHGIATLFLAMTLFYGLYILRMNVSQILFFCGLLHMFYEPIKRFAEQNTYIQKGIAAAERMYEVLDIHPHIKDHDGAIDLPDFQHAIEFDNVWFKYEDQWVIKGLSFTIRKGETVAIVGPTGAGKSTIVQLLPRLYDIDQGEIRIDGQPLTDYTQRSLRENIAFVPQKPFLFLDTVAENIAFGRDFTEEEVHDAAHRAHADEFIDNLPEGYHTQLAEAGKNLSGGQQQRLAIARALVKNAPILVMDEATSSLDSVSENRIKMAINELHGDVTQILIAHRFSTIENADRIIFLRHGEKIAEGTKDELLASCPDFKLMWEMLHNPEAIAADP